MTDSQKRVLHLMLTRSARLVWSQTALSYRLLTSRSREGVSIVTVENMVRERWLAGDAREWFVTELGRREYQAATLRRNA